MYRKTHVNRQIKQHKDCIFIEDGAGFLTAGAPIAITPSGIVTCGNQYVNQH